MDDPSLFDQHEADQRVIAELLREIKRRQGMSNLNLALVDGVIMRLKDVEEVGVAEVEKLLSDARAEVMHLESLLAELQKLAKPAASTEVAQSNQEQINGQAQPTAADPNTNQGADQTTAQPAQGNQNGQAAPEAQQQQVVAPEQPATPATDPNAAPVLQ